jgi:O-antigen/teichoic acid export membrane protein
VNDIGESMRIAIGTLLHPRDVSTEDGRSRERLRRIGLTAIASVLAKVVGIIITLLTVPLTVGYLGLERYGVWMTISSVIAVLGFADLGLGNGLLNAITDAHGRDDRQAAREYLSSALLLLSGIAMAILLAFSVSYNIIDWQRVFNISSPIAIDEAGPAMFIFMVCFALNLPLSTIHKVQLGYQEGFINGLWTALGSILSLVGILLTILFKGGLPWLVFAMAGLPAFATFLNGLIMIRYKKPWLAPALSSVSRRASQRILRIGVLFFILQISVAFAYSSDNIILAQILGPEAVTQYSVPMNLFTVAPMLIMMALGPLWPAYGEALVRHDFRWVKETLKKSLLAVILFTGVAAVFLVLFGGTIINWWVGSSIQPSFLLLLGLGIWMIIGTAGNALAMFLNGANIVGIQVVTSIILAAGALILKIILVRVIGIPGVIWATIIVYSAVVVIPYSFIIPRVIRKITAG